MRLKALAVVAGVLCVLAVVIYVASSPQGAPTAQQPASPEASTSEEPVPHEGRRPRSRHAVETPTAQPTGEAEASRAWKDTWEQARQIDVRTARELAPFLAERDDLYHALHEAGMLKTDELLLARIERAYNEYVTASGEARRRALAVIESSERELGASLQRKVESGFLSGADATAMTGAVAALRSSLRWYDATAPSTSFPELPPTQPAAKEGPAATGQRTKRDRSTIAAGLREARTRGLKEEAAALERLLAYEPPPDKSAERAAARVRHLVVRAQLGEIDFAAARRQADEILGSAQLDAAASQNLRDLVGLLEWYGGAVMRRLYGE